MNFRSPTVTPAEDRQKIFIMPCNQPPWEMTGTGD